MELSNEIKHILDKVEQQDMKLVTVKKDVASRNERIEALSESLESKESRANFEQLLERFNSFSDVDSIQKL